MGRSYLSMIDEHQYPVFTASIEELLTEPDRVIYDIKLLVKGNSTRWGMAEDIMVPSPTKKDRWGSSH